MSPLGASIRRAFPFSSCWDGLSCVSVASPLPRAKYREYRLINGKAAVLSTIPIMRLYDNASGDQSSPSPPPSSSSWGALRPIKKRRDASRLLELKTRPPICSNMKPMLMAIYHGHPPCPPLCRPLPPLPRHLEERQHESRARC